MSLSTYILCSLNFACHVMGLCTGIASKPSSECAGLEKHSSTASHPEASLLSSLNHVFPNFPLIVVLL